MDLERGFYRTGNYTRTARPARVEYLFGYSTTRRVFHSKTPNLGYTMHPVEAIHSRGVYRRKYGSSMKGTG